MPYIGNDSTNLKIIREFKDLVKYAPVARPNKGLI